MRNPIDAVVRPLSDLASALPGPALSLTPLLEALGHLETMARDVAGMHEQFVAMRRDIVVLDDHICGLRSDVGALSGDVAGIRVATEQLASQVDELSESLGPVGVLAGRLGRFGQRRRARAEIGAGNPGSDGLGAG